MKAMSFWNSLFGFFWREESTLVLVMALVLVALLFHFHRKEERKTVTNTLALFFVCLFGQFISGLLHAFEFTKAAEILREAFVIGGGVAIIRLWGVLIFRTILPAIKLSPPRITEDISVIVVYIAWGLVRLRYAGLDLSGIVATSAMITAVVAFSMQDTLGNILGGVALQMDNSIEVGDWIKVDDIQGRVVDIRWRATLVETRNWETVVFPNSQLMKGKFVVLGRRSGQPVQLRRWVWFNVSADAAAPRVINTVEEAIRQIDIPNVAKEPVPNCVLMDMDDKGYLRYAVRYWLTDLAIDDPTDAAMRWHIATALQREGIRLAVDERNIHLTKETEKYEEGVRHREVALRLKILRKVELFSQMTDEELTVLAERLRFSQFARGDIISKQGASAHWLYIIISGEAEVYLEVAGGGKHVLRDLGRNSFFGEMGLMTGAPRSASVMAKTDVECYRVDKDMFEEILHARPAIAEEMSQIMAIRKAEQNVALQDISEEAAHAGISQQRTEILATIRRFFGLDK
jgi:CRP-like cAMP-binding protein/small-conductance mechanosensitive channel